MNTELGILMGGDCVFINSGMFPPLDDEFRVVIEQIKDTSTKDHLIVVLETNGGIMETVERLVAVMRTHYSRVSFVIPNFAYSAGTVLALSGDKIFMDYYSVLGPIDPQYRDHDGSYLPGHGVVSKYEELMKDINKAETADEVRAELAFLIKNFDPAQIFQIEQSIEHGITLITEWLPKYKFKDWNKTATKGKAVTPTMRKNRARKIAETLGDASKWHSHGRGISMHRLMGEELKLEIDNFGANDKLNSPIRNYHGLADVSINTVSKLLIAAGEACAKFHDENVRDIKSKHIQCDEIWSFVGAKQKNVKTMKEPVEGAGDVWTWTALDADSKMIVAYLVGGRGADYANFFMEDVASRLANSVQMTTDGHRAYLEAVEGAFGADC